MRENRSSSLMSGVWKRSPVDETEPLRHTSTLLLFFEVMWLSFVFGVVGRVDLAGCPPRSTRPARLTRRHARNPFDRYKAPIDPMEFS